MAIQNVSGLTPLIKPVVDPELIDSVFAQQYFLRLFHSIDRGGVAYTVKAIVTGNTGVDVVAEGGSMPSAGAAVYQTGSFSPVDCFVVYGWTGAAERAYGDMGDFSYWPGAQAEEQDALVRLRDDFEEAFMEDAATGLLGQVDDDTTAWGGINRGTYDALQSLVVEGGSAVVSDAMLAEGYFGLAESPHGVKPELIFSSPLQQRSYVENVLSTPVNAAGGARGDVGFSELSYMNVPWIGIPGFVNSEIVLLSGLVVPQGADPETASVIFVNHENRRGTTRIQLGPSCYANIAFKDYGASGDSLTRQASMSGMLVVRRPHKQAKIEALATSW